MTATSRAGRAQALVKPIGVVSGISDVPWHKDCSLGRHSYDCCGMTVGISVTGADATSGQLRVIAGSHRGLVWPAFVAQGHRPSGDRPAHRDRGRHRAPVVHDAHVAAAGRPRAAVIYSGFALPPADADAVAAARKRLYRIMQAIPEGVSQKPTVVVAD